MSKKRSITLSRRDLSRAGSIGLTDVERRERAAKLAQVDAGAKVVVEEDECAFRDRVRKRIECREAGSASSRKQRMVAARDRAHMRAGGGRMVPVTDKVTDAFEFLLENGRHLSAWEKSFVEDVLEFASSRSQITPKQWMKVQEIEKRLSHRL